MKNNIKYQKFDHSASNFIYYVDNKNNRYIYHSYYPYLKWKTRVYEFVILSINVGLDIKFGIRIRKLCK